jgi:hypothetical protein
MESLPTQPKQIKAEPPGLQKAAVQRLKQSIGVTEDSSISSIGEVLLPYLLGAVQACWITAILIALASTGLFVTSSVLIPLWAPFVLILGSLLLFHYLGIRTEHTTVGENDPARRKQIDVSETSLFIILVAVASLFFIWLSLYSQNAFLFDPRWLLHFFGDVLSLNGYFYESICIIGITGLLCWMGVKLINRNIEPSDVFRAFFVGLGIFIVVIVFRTGQASTGAVMHDDFFMLLLIPLFLIVSLMTHALARVVFIRKSHPAGLQGSIVAQERAIMLLIGSLGLLLLLFTLLIGTTTNSVLFANLEHILTVLGMIYNWLVDIVAAIIVILVLPIFWLILLIHPTTQFGTLTRFRASKPAPNPGLDSMQEAFTHAIIPILSIILPVLFAVLMILLVRWSLRRRQRVRKRVNRRNLDVHESLWSWSLFWLQFRSFMLALFARFIHREIAAGEGVVKIEPMQGSPSVRSIREIYRAFLQKAARQGYPRRKFETPDELRQRVDEKVPLAEPQLELITEAYTMVRYSGEVPDDAQLVQIRAQWQELDRKWT